MEAPRLRAATDADAPLIAEVLLASREAFLPYAPMTHSQHEVRCWVRDVLVPSGGVTVACVGPSLVVGVVAAVVCAQDASRIDQLYVAPAYVGRGIGTGLLRHALATLPSRLPVRLHVFQWNLQARRFYERHGFVPIAFSDGRFNEERCPDVEYERAARPAGLN